MEIYLVQIIETIVILLMFFVAKELIIKVIDRIASKYEYHKPRVKMIKKLISVLLYSLTIIFLLFVWGVNQSELIFFLSSLLTVLGIAFFAQWSIISNITSGLIIFINHPIKIGDSIIVLDNDYQIEGRISDIGLFFIILKTTDDEVITIPSNLFMQKMIKKKKLD